VVLRLLQSGAYLDLAEQGSDIALLPANAGTDIDHLDRTEDNGASIWAALRGHLHAVQVLVANGADRGLRDRRELSALEWARRND